MKRKISMIFLVLVLIASMFLMCGPDDLLKGVEKRDMIEVTGGTYTQQDTNGHSFEHTISSFTIGKYEVTYGLWNTVYVWATSNDYNFANLGREGSEDASPTNNSLEPVTSINWRDAIVWCNAYSEMSGFNPVYKSGGNVLKDSRDDNASNCDFATANWSANGYRLPTEGEWQYAASNKGATAYNFASGGSVAYNDSDEYENDCKKVAWFYSYDDDSDYIIQ